MHRAVCVYFPGVKPAPHLLLGDRNVNSLPKTRTSDLITSLMSPAEP